MPRSVKRANGDGNGGKRGDQRAETAVRRGARFNRIVLKVLAHSRDPDVAAPGSRRFDIATQLAG
jgi:hypothetical protein